MFFTSPTKYSLAAAAEGPRPRVALLSMPRTGSTMIQNQLQKHENVYFVPAIFSIKGWDGMRGIGPFKRGLDPCWDDLSYRVANHRELMDRLFTCHPRAECVGFKHHLSGAREVTETVLGDPTIAKIVLIRSNVLASYSSDRMVRLKEDQEAGELGPDKPVFDAKDFGHYERKRSGVYKRWQARWEAAGGDLKVVDYIDARTPEGIGGVMDFLGVPRADLIPGTKKRGSDDIVSRFENPGAVRDYLAANDLEHWAEESPAA